MIWVCFMDMHSGGGNKVKPYEYLYIEAERRDAAERRFENLFGRSPENVTCSCCGEDYSLSSHESLEQLTGYERGCEYRDGAYLLDTARVSLDDYLSRSDVFVERGSARGDS